METKIMPPQAFSMLNSMRAIGYSFETAVADIIDNSIAAQASDIRLLTEQDPNKEPVLAIIDDGIGMSSDELLDALKHACRNPDAKRKDKDLGRFGLGLKTASLSQCRKLTVISKKDQKISAAEWDLDYVKDTEDWSLKTYSENETEQLPFFEELEALDSGTIVLWRSFDRLELSNNEIFNTLHIYLSRVKDYISLVFHRFLSGDNTKKLRMSINDIEIEPKDPFARKLKERSSKEYPMETLFLKAEGRDYAIQAVGYTLPSQNKMTTEEIDRLGLKDRKLSDDQGFYIYRNFRLINWGTWLRLNKKAQRTKLSRVQVDIPNTMDHLWELDIKKSQALPPKQIRDRLSDLLDEWVQDSVNVETGRGTRRIASDLIPAAFWEIREVSQQDYFIEINEENRILKSLVETLTEEQYKKLRAYLTLMAQTYPIDIVTAKFCQDKNFSIASSDSEEKELSHIQVNILSLLETIPEKEDKIDFLKRLKLTTTDNSETKKIIKVIKRILDELENE